jgi:hypothetical protein
LLLALLVFLQDFDGPRIHVKLLKGPRVSADNVTLVVQHEAQTAGASTAAHSAADNVTLVVQHETQETDASAADTHNDVAVTDVAAEQGTNGIGEHQRSLQEDAAESDGVVHLGEGQSAWLQVIFLACSPEVHLVLATCA